MSVPATVKEISSLSDTDVFSIDEVCRSNTILSMSLTSIVVSPAVCAMHIVELSNVIFVFSEISTFKGVEEPLI